MIKVERHHVKRGITVTWQSLIHMTVGLIFGSYLANKYGFSIAEFSGELSEYIVVISGILGIYQIFNRRGGRDA